MNTTFRVNDSKHQCDNAIVTYFLELDTDQITVLNERFQFQIRATYIYLTVKDKLLQEGVTYSESDTFTYLRSTANANRDRQNESFSIIITKLDRDNRTISATYNHSVDLYDTQAGKYVHEVKTGVLTDVHY
jgi:hypothetical protein